MTHAQLAPVDAILAIDVGNTRIGMTICDADGVHDTQRVPLRGDPRSDDELRAAWRDTLAHTWRAAAPSPKRTVAVAIASVVPDLTPRIRALAAEITGEEPLRVRDDIPLPMPLDIENPHEVGVDRICSAAAAFDRVREACAVASFGSAITIDFVSAQGVFRGGAILPGLELSFDALHDRTAALPRVGLGEPCGAFGRNTHDAILNGVVYGAIGALREIVERYATDLNRWPQLILTGGNAALIARHADFADAVVPDLCLMGVALAYRKAAGCGT